MTALRAECPSATSLKPATPRLERASPERVQAVLESRRLSLMAVARQVGPSVLYSALFFPAASPTAVERVCAVLRCSPGDLAAGSSRRR